MPAEVATQQDLNPSLIAGLTPEAIVVMEAELELRRRRKIRNDSMEEQRSIWREHPIQYALERFGVHLTPDQEKIFHSVRDNRRTLVKASHAIGKTYVVGIVLNWWFDCWWGHHIAYITAPTWTSALGLTFKYTKKFRLDNNINDAEILDSGWIRNTERNLRLTHYIRTLNSETGEGFQGEHSADILVVLEEAVGVPGYIWDASEGLMTAPGCRIVAIGNPTDEATKFGEMSDAPSWEVFSISALDHPNISAELLCEPPPYPGAIRLLWLYEMLQKECDQVGELIENSFEFYSLEDIRKALDGVPVSDTAKKSWYKPTANFQGRVLGEFPTEASDKVIPSGWLKHLPVQELPANRVDAVRRLQVGCDPARFGDDRTTIFVKLDGIALSAREIRQFDSDKISQAIIDAIMDALHLLGEARDINLARNVTINIDITGGLGTGPLDLLISKGFKAQGINSSERANEAALYRNKRSELWFNVAERIKNKDIDISRLPLDIVTKLKKELSTPHYTVKVGKKVVEEKSEIKKRLGSSSDLADGFNLAFYDNFSVSATTVSQFRR